MKTLFLLLLVSFYGLCLTAQPIVTRSASIGFFSKTPLEDIKAENNQVQAVIDPTKKTLAFAMLMKSFLFDKELMQEHFNENFIESDQFPKASFSGSYTGDVDVSNNGTYNVQVNGQITLHGVTRNLTVPAVLTVQNNKLIGHSQFFLKPSDFNIKIPALVKDKIAQQITVTVKTDFNLPN